MWGAGDSVARVAKLASKVLGKDMPWLDSPTAEAREQITNLMEAWYKQHRKHKLAYEVSRAVHQARLGVELPLRAFEALATKIRLP